MKEKKELNEIQQYAIRSAYREAELGKKQLNNIATQILQELGITKEEIRLWNFQDNFSYVEKIQDIPKKRIPKKESKK